MQDLHANSMLTFSHPDIRLEEAAAAATIAFIPDSGRSLCAFLATTSDESVSGSTLPQSREIRTSHRPCNFGPKRQRPIWLLALAAPWHRSTVALYRSSSSAPQLPAGPSPSQVSAFCCSSDCETEAWSRSAARARTGNTVRSRSRTPGVGFRRRRH